MPSELRNATIEKMKDFLGKIFDCDLERKYRVLTHMDGHDAVVTLVYQGSQLRYLVQLYESGGGRVTTYTPTVEYDADGRVYPIAEDYQRVEFDTLSDDWVKEARLAVSNNDTYSMLEAFTNDWVCMVNDLVNSGMDTQSAVAETNKHLGELP